MGPLRAGAGLLAVLLSVQTATALKAVSVATPVQKVIELLDRLEAQVGKEGAKEAAEYDKFACFCKEQADDKTYAIEKSDKKVKELQAQIDMLTADITSLDAEAVALGVAIDGLKANITDEEADRAAEHAEYEIADENVTGAIKAVGQAIQMVKMSKSEMGKDVKVDLAEVAKKVVSAIPNPTKAQAKAVASLLDASKPGKPPAYEYRSNDIIATLESLADEFEENKKQLDLEEFEAKAVSDKRVLAWTNEKKFKSDSKIKKEELSSKKTTEKEDAEKERDEEKDDMDADKAFREELTAECQDKAKEFDQRSTTRSAELKALAEAKEVLKSGDVNKMYGNANKKLSGLATVAVKVHKAPAPKTVSLLQVRRNTGAHTAVSAAAERLQQLADKLKSPTLAAIAAKVSLAGGADHFGKVRGLISDLIKKLEDEAAAEVDSKSFCDKNMGDSVGSRDEHKLNIEAQGATISQKTVKIAELQGDIAELSKEISELAKALNEATELRSNEKAANEQTLADAEQGKFAVTKAISVLEGFYGESLLQGNKKSAQKSPDRDGKSVSDRAPKMSYSGDYDGNQQQSSGVIGLLNVILSDFERTESTIGDEESAAAEEYDTLKSDTKDAVDDKQKLVKTKEGEMEDAEVDITDAKDALASAQALHEDSLKELERLKVMCVEGADSWAERKKQRESEIDALKQASALLENW